MTNLEKYISEMVKNIKSNGGADSAYHWSELVMVLEEALKYIPQETPLQYDIGLFFVGYTNPYQLVHSCDKVEPSGSFYPTTEEDTTIPLFMLKCHEHRLLNITDGDLSLAKLKELQEGGEL